MARGHAPGRAAALLSALVLAGCGGGLPTAAPASPSGSTGSSTAGRGGPAAATPSADPPSIEAFIPEAERFVEVHRGHPFKRPVTVTALADAAFRARLLDAENQGNDPKQLADTTNELRALGLLSGNVDVGRLQQSLLAGAVSGFYDPRAKALFVRGVAPTPYVRGVLVHELTHALQDQYFSIDRPALDKASDERGLAWHAVLEGDAVRIEEEYRASLSTDDQLRSTQEEQDAANAVPSDIPPVLVQSLAFPYSAGPGFMRSLALRGGLTAVDAAFTTPPTTSEQVLHPERFAAGEAGRPVAAPPAEGAVFDQGVLGEFGLELVLSDAVRRGEVDRATAAQAHLGWGGDQYVAWSSGARSCVRARVVMDTPAARALLGRVLGTIASRRPGVTVTSGNDGLVYTSCG